MLPLSKYKKQIKSLAKKKWKKSSVPLEHSDFDDSNSEWENEEEIIWEDVEFNQKSETFVKVLLDEMKNYVPPIRKSVYIGNSVWTKKRKKAQAKQLLIKNGQPITKFFNPLPPPQPNSDKSDSDQESKCEEHFNYEQLIISIENKLKQNHDSDY